MSAFIARRDDFADAIEIDGVTSVRTDASWLVTEYPVADAVSDHSQRRPRRYTLDCILTETPPDGTERDPERVQNVIDWLTQNAGQLLDVDVSSEREPIRSVLIEGLPRSYSTFRSVRLTLMLREVQIVATQSTTLPAVSTTPKANAASGRAQETNDGEQAPTEARDTSTVADLADLAASLFGG